MRKSWGTLRWKAGSVFIVMEAIYDYVYSCLGNAPCILDRSGDKFRQLIQESIDCDGSFFIHKSAGMFVCEK